MKILSIITLSILTGLMAIGQDNIYGFKVKALDGSEIDFSAFKGKKILIVNTASECGFTPQYEQLQELHNLKKDELIIIGFPANNFGKQEPGSNEEIGAFCKKNYGVTFLMASKVSVKGDDQHPIFTWLTAQENPDFKGNIRWNFEKILVDENGKVIHRYRSGVKPTDEKIVGVI